MTKNISYLLSFATTNYNDKVFLRDIKKKLSIFWVL